MVYKYGVLAENEVDINKRKLAHQALAFARKDLQLPMVKIKWFEHIEYVKNPIETFESDFKLNGIFLGSSKDSIYIRGSLGREGIKEAVLHETYHYMQFRCGFGFGDHSEKNAFDYTEDALKRYKYDQVTYIDHLSGKDWSILKKDPRAIKWEQTTKPKNSYPEYIRTTSAGHFYKKYTKQR